jgi:hypothetical protein
MVLPSIEIVKGKPLTFAYQREIEGYNRITHVISMQINELYQEVSGIPSV